MDLYPFAETLVQEMVISGVDVGQHGCPVVFVCHCVGGLIAKQIIVLAYECFKQDTRIQKLLCITRAFVFYGTPHAESELISEDSRTEVARLNSAFESIRCNVFMSKWVAGVVAETHRTPTNWFSYSMIVKEASARHVGYGFISVGEDHSNLCKPKTKRNTSYLYLTGCVMKVVDEYGSFQADLMLELPRCVVGVDEKMIELCGKLKDNPIVGLVGVGGVGKTTLSKAMFNKEPNH